MPVICPTCQIFSNRSATTGLLRRLALRNDEKRRSIEKTRGQFPGAGSKILAKMKICR
jgi:hypothetical protein